MATNNDYDKVMFYPMVIVYDAKNKRYEASFPDLIGCVAYGETEEEAFNNVLDAKLEWLKEHQK